MVVNASSKQWEGRSYGVKTGGDARPLVEVFNTQAAEYGGWETSGNKEAEVAPKDGKAFMNVPKWSVLVFKPV